LSGFKETLKKKQPIQIPAFTTLKQALAQTGNLTLEGLQNYCFPIKGVRKNYSSDGMRNVMAIR